jgi:VWFA-related protein
MRKVFFHCVTLLVLLSLSLLPTSFAQSKTQNKRKIKNFGSSLKRLQWDPVKNETVLRESNSAMAEEDVDVIRIETSLVAWDVLVLDQKGDNVNGLTAADFLITEDDQPQTVGHFLLGDNQTVERTIVLIIDYSGSQFPFIRKSINAAKVLVDKLGPLDRMAIVTDDVELLVDFTNDKTLLKNKLESLIDRINRDGGFLGFGKERRVGKSKQYSALMATLNEMFSETDQRQIIVFQTDGDEVFRMRDSIIPPALPPDLPPETRPIAEEFLVQRRQSLLANETVFTLADVYRAVEKSRATIYTIIPGFRLVGVPADVQVNLVKTEFERSRNILLSKLNPAERAKRIEEDERQWRPLSPANLKARTAEAYKVQLALSAVAPRTGGWTEYLETPEQASTIYSRIFSDINQRYILGYYPTNKKHDGKRRRINVEVKGHPEYTIIGRRSYYAPAQ